MITVNTCRLGGKLAVWKRCIGQTFIIAQTGANMLDLRGKRMSGEYGNLQYTENFIGQKVGSWWC
jgi:hypothetical protein